MKKFEELKILVLGLEKEGRTSLIKFLSSKSQTKTEEKINEFNVIILENEYFNKLKIWNIEGLNSIRNYCENFYDKPDGLVFVVDTSDDYIFDEEASFFKFVLSKEKLRKIPILIFANKQDKDYALLPNEIQEKMDLSSIHIPWSVNACVDTTGEGFIEGMKWLFQTISKYQFSFF